VHAVVVGQNLEVICAPHVRERQSFISMIPLTPESDSDFMKRQKRVPPPVIYAPRASSAVLSALWSVCGMAVTGDECRRMDCDCPLSLGDQ
jgi:hypothetical protein